MAFAMEMRGLLGLGGLNQAVMEEGEEEAGMGEVQVLVDRGEVVVRVTLQASCGIANRGSG